MITWSDITKFFENPIVNVVVAAVVGGGVSWYVSWATIGPSQDRELRLERMSAFSASADEFLTLGTGIVSQLAVYGLLSDNKLALGNASARQAVGAQDLVELFGPVVTDEARSYQNALAAFVETTNRLQDPSEIKQWVVAFDDVVIAQRSFKASLNEALEVQPLDPKV